MAIRNKALTVNFLAWDTVNNRGKTGDAHNITLKVVKDGSAPVAVTTGITESDTAAMPGIYQIPLTQSEMDGDFICICGVSSSTGVIVYPVFLQTESGSLAVIQNLLEQIKIKTDGIPSDIASQSDVSSSRDSVLTAISGNGSKIDTVSTSVNLLWDSGVRLNSAGKNDVKEQITISLTQQSIPELTSVPQATPTIAQAVMLQYMSLRNRTENSENSMSIFNDKGEVIASAHLDDSGNMFTKHKMVTLQPVS